MLWNLKSAMMGRVGLQGSKLNCQQNSSTNTRYRQIPIRNGFRGVPRALHNCQYQYKHSSNVCMRNKTLKQSVTAYIQY